MSAFLIWSNQHGMWWWPNERGYTAHIEEAGRYTRAAAQCIVDNASVNGQLLSDRTNPVTGQQYWQAPEVMVLAPETAAQLTAELDAIGDVQVIEHEGRQLRVIATVLHDRLCTVRVATPQEGTDVLHCAFCGFCYPRQSGEAVTSR